MTRKKGHMKWPLFTKIINEIAAENPQSRVWLVFFGEPLILKKTTPSIFDMIRYCKQEGLANVVLNSNGNLLDIESSSKLLDAGLDELYIGIDAFSKDTYDKLRVGGNYNNTVQNILNFKNILKSRNLKHYSIQVQFVEMAINQHEKDPFVRFWTSKGISVKIRQKLTWAGLIQDDNNTPKQDRHQCYWAMDTISITDQGDVVTCAADPDARFIAGNLGDQSIREIWSGVLRDLRILHRENRWHELPHPCDKCMDWQVSYRDILIPGKQGTIDRISAFCGNIFPRLKHQRAR
jgi:radical SAM protein with 4Fe4S-binding SPASM domain